MALICLFQPSEIMPQKGVFSFLIYGSGEKSALNAAGQRHTDASPCPFRQEIALKNAVENQKSVGKYLSALSSAACKHLAAVSGGHSLAEAVLFKTLSFLRLICSLCDHGFDLLPGINTYAIAL